MDKFYTCLMGLRSLFSQQEIVAVLVMLTGCVIAMIFWLVLMSQLIALHPKRRNPYRYVIWGIYLPYLNLLWIPWAIISANSIVKKVQENYGNKDSLGSAAGVQILAIPSLVLYLFWGVIFTMMMRYSCLNHASLEMAMYSCVAVACILLVFAFYLIYLSAFVHKITELLKSKVNKS